MQSKLSTEEQEAGRQIAQRKDQMFLKTSSEDVPLIMNTGKIVEEMNEQVSEIEVERVECECCGMSEDCTPTYIRRVKDFFHGKWICGLCSEAVKEQMKRAPTVTKDEALESHMSLSKKFNGTIRLNPKLSLAVSMKDIARKISERRTIKHFSGSKIQIVKAMSYGPSFDVGIKQS